MDSVIFNILFLAVILMAIIFLIIGNKQNSGMTKKAKDHAGADTGSHGNIAGIAVFISRNF